MRSNFKKIGLFAALCFSLIFITGATLSWYGVLSYDSITGAFTSLIPIGSPNVYIADNTEADQCVAGNGRTIYALAVANGVNEKCTIKLSHLGAANNTDYACSTTWDATAYTDITLEFENGARLKDTAANASFTWGGMIKAEPDQQIFNWGNGSGAISLLNSYSVFVDWFATNTNPGTTSMRTAFSQAVLACPATGGKVIFPGKTYLIDSTLSLASYPYVTVEIAGNAVLSLSAGTTLTFGGMLIANGNSPNGSYPQFEPENICITGDGTYVLASGRTSIFRNAVFLGRETCLVGDSTTPLDGVNGACGWYRPGGDMFAIYSDGIQAFGATTDQKIVIGDGDQSTANLGAHDTVLQFGRGFWGSNIDNTDTRPIIRNLGLENYGTIMIGGNVTLGSTGNSPICIGSPTGAQLTSATADDLVMMPGKAIRFVNNEDTDSGSVLSHTDNASNATVLSGQEVTIAQDQVISLGAGGNAGGFVIITCSEEYASAMFHLNGGGNEALEVLDPKTKFSITKDTATSINVYSETDQYRIQNKFAASKTIMVVILGVN